MRRFARETEEHCKDLLDLSRADITSKIPGRRQKLLQQIHALEQRVEHLQKLDQTPPPLPKGLGTRIMNTFDLPPSKQIGNIIKALEQSVAQGDLLAHQDESYYIEFLKTSDIVKQSSVT